jgi:hypothetical protein
MKPRPRINREAARNITHAQSGMVIEIVDNSLTLQSFKKQAINAHDNLQELLHMIDCDKLPLLVRATFTDEDATRLQAAFTVLKRIATTLDEVGV